MSTTSTQVPVAQITPTVQEMPNKTVISVTEEFNEKFKAQAKEIDNLKELIRSFQLNKTVVPLPSTTTPPASTTPPATATQATPTPSQPTNTSSKKVAEIDHLVEDTPIESQKWVLFSFLTPRTVKNSKQRMMKFRGAYPTKQEAEDAAKILNLKDPDIHVYVGEGFKWVDADPDPNAIADQRYSNEKMNELMKEYMEATKKSKMEEASRIADSKSATVAQMREQKKQKYKEILQKKLAEKKEENTMVDRHARRRRNKKLATKQAEVAKTPIAEEADEESESVENKLAEIEQKKKLAEQKLQAIRASQAQNSSSTTTSTPTPPTPSPSTVPSAPEAPKPKRNIQEVLAKFKKSHDAFQQKLK